MLSISEIIRQFALSQLRKENYFLLQHTGDSASLILFSVGGETEAGNLSKS
jgi:hypothetical protein